MIDLVGTERAGEIARRHLFVGAVADPRIRLVAEPLLLELVEEIAEPAAEHAAGCAAGQQAAQSALEDVAETAAHPTARERRGHIAGRGRWCRPRLCAGLTAAKMLHCLPGEQSQDRHGHRRLAAAGRRVALLARPRVIGEIRDNGLRLTNFDGSEQRLAANQLTLSEDPSIFGQTGVVLVTVKSADTIEIAETLAKHAPQDAVV